MDRNSGASAHAPLCIVQFRFRAADVIVLTFQGRQLLTSSRRSRETETDICGRDQVGKRGCIVSTPARRTAVERRGLTERIVLLWFYLFFF